MKIQPFNECIEMKWLGNITMFNHDEILINIVKGHASISPNVLVMQLGSYIAYEVQKKNQHLVTHLVHYQHHLFQLSVP